MLRSRREKAQNTDTSCSQEQAFKTLKKLGTHGDQQSTLRHARESLAKSAAVCTARGIAGRNRCSRSMVFWCWLLL